MGGIGSGRQDGRPTVDAGFPLDINKLLRDCNILPGQWKRGTLHWTVVVTGHEVASLSYEANLVDPAAAWMQLRYAIGDGEARQTFDCQAIVGELWPNLGDGGVNKAAYRGG